MHFKHRSIGAAVCALLLFAAPAASAQTSAQPGYSTPAGNVQQQVGGGHDAPSPNTVENRGGSLPFTGLDLGLVGAAGGFLLAVGFAVRRLSRSEI